MAGKRFLPFRRLYFNFDNCFLCGADNIMWFPFAYSCYYFWLILLFWSLSPLFSLAASDFYNEDLDPAAFWMRKRVIWFLSSLKNIQLSWHNFLELLSFSNMCFWSPCEDFSVYICLTFFLRLHSLVSTLVL